MDRSRERRESCRATGTQPNRCALSSRDIRRHIGDEQQNATSDEKEQIMLLDMPGHPRLRADALAAVAPSGGIIFFVDAADSDRIKEAAAYVVSCL